MAIAESRRNSARSVDRSCCLVVTKGEFMPKAQNGDRNLVAAIERAGQVPMPYQVAPWGPAVVSFYCNAAELQGLRLSVAHFRKTLDAAMAIVASRIYGGAAYTDKKGAVGDHRIHELVFPDGSATYAIFWPGVEWKREYNPNPPLQITLGGPDSPSKNSAQAVHLRRQIA
jgi:hypothetical protein